MASPSEEVCVDGELVEPEVKDPDYSGANPEFTTSKTLKEEGEDRAKEENKKEVGKDEKKNVVENLKSSLIISGVVIAVIGAIFAVAKKIKEA